MGFLEKLANYFTGQGEEDIPKLGRNDPCWCGSGKKYKRCHLEEDEKKRSRQRAATCSTN